MASHDKIFSICTSRMYCCHINENRIQLSKYKDYLNGSFNIFKILRISLSIMSEKYFVILRRIWWVSEIGSGVTWEPNSLFSMLPYQKELIGVFVCDISIAGD